MWWPLLLVPLLVWAVYAIGTPWPESAPVGVNLETYGEPWNIGDVRSELRGHDFWVREIELHKGDKPGELFDLSGPVIEASVDFDGRGATLYVYPDASSMQEDWVEENGSLRPRDTYVTDVNFTALENVVIFESGWGSAGLGAALQDLDR